MGSGVAKAIREKWPKAYDAYKQVEKHCGLYLGKTIIVTVDDKVVINAITQEFYGRGKKFVNYQAIMDVFYYLGNYLETRPTHIAMPKIGAGLSGGDWDVIAALIEESSGNRIQPVVYSLGGKI